MTDNSVQYDCDLFEWADKRQSKYPRNSYNSIDVSNEEFDYDAFLNRRIEEGVDPPPPSYKRRALRPTEPPKRMSQAAIDEAINAPDDFMPALLEMADLMYESWGPVQEEDDYLKFLRNRASNARRRKHVYDAGGTFTADDIVEIFDLQDGRCCYCGMPFHSRADFHIDHIDPISKGGSNSPENIALACVSCNLSKSDHAFEEWRCLRGWY